MGEPPRIRVLLLADGIEVRAVERDAEHTVGRGVEVETRVALAVVVHGAPPRAGAPATVRRAPMMPLAPRPAPTGVRPVTGIGYTCAVTDEQEVPWPSASRSRPGTS